MDVPLEKSLLVKVLSHPIGLNSDTASRAPGRVIVSLTSHQNLCVIDVTELTFIYHHIHFVCGCFLMHLKETFGIVLLIFFVCLLNIKRLQRLEVSIVSVVIVFCSGSLVLPQQL